MDNFSVFEYSLGLITGVPYGALVTILIIAIIGKFSSGNKESNSKGS